MQVQADSEIDPMCWHLHPASGWRRSELSYNNSFVGGVRQPWRRSIYGRESSAGRCYPPSLLAVKRATGRHACDSLKVQWKVQSVTTCTTWQVHAAQSTTAIHARSAWPTATPRQRASGPSEGGSCVGKNEVFFSRSSYRGPLVTITR